jgi:hypothetical protein
MRRQLVASGAAVTTALAVGLAMSALPAVATHVQPVLKTGNPTCSQLVDGGVTEFKIDPVTGGTHTDGTLSVTITLHDTAAGQTFDWTSNIGVDAVFAKGGPQGNLYVYSPEATSDTGLHAPANASGTWAGLSHISFCYDKDETTTPPTKPPTTPPTTPPTESPTTPPTTETPTVAPTTPAPVPTEVPAGATDGGSGGSGSGGLVGLVLAGAAAAAGAAVVARRRFLHDS